MKTARPGRKQTARKRPPATSAAAAPADRWLKIAAVLLAAVCLLGYFAVEIVDTDFWWHLKTGQYIVERHSLPVPDPFAYTTALDTHATSGEIAMRHFNLSHEWLSQAMMYLTYAAGGFPAIVLARSILLTFICGIAGVLSTRAAGDIYAGIAAAVAAAMVAIEFATDRPTLVTFAFVALFVAILEFRIWVWVLPVIAIVWANCHGGFFLGWVVLGAYSIEALAPYPRYAARERWRLWSVSVCAIAISGLNPNGFGVIQTVLQYRRSELMMNLVEWRRPLLWGPPYSFDLLLYAAAVVLIVSWRKVRLAHWLLFAAFAAASLTAFRNILLIGFLAPFLICAYFPIRVPSFQRALAWAVPIFLIAALAAGAVQGRFFQLGVAEWLVPAGAATYVLSNHITAPLFNTYEHGGYLIWRLWPEERVFIDGRALSESVNREYRQILYNSSSAADRLEGPRAEIMRRYGVNVVVMNTIDYISGAVYPLALALANPASAEWQLVYEDPEAVVFLREPSRGIPAFANKLGRVLNHLDTECLAYIEHSPQTPLCARTLGEYWMRNGVRNRARRMLLLYLQHVSNDAQAQQMLRQLDAQPAAP